MSENFHSQTTVTPPPILAERKPSKFIKATVPLETPLYEEIESLLPELSNLIGSKVTMPVFLRKTIVENWKVQMERYRKLNPSAKRSSP